MTDPIVPRRVRIVSDGTSNGTKVTDADTGIEIPATKAEWSLEAPGIAVVKLTLNAPVCDLVATEQE